MYFNLLWIILVVCAALCAIGFYKFVYFLSIGYGFAVAGGGIAILIMALVAPTEAPIWITIIQAALFIVYGARLSGFLLVREIKNIAFKKTEIYKETLTKGDKKMPIFVLATIWVFVSILYTAQVSPMFFRYANGSTEWIAPVIGFVISIGGIVLEAIADKQKSEQKAKNPKFVATEGLYKIVRCPNYLGEITFWTGVFISGVTAYQGWGQWITAILAYIAIVFIMFNGAQRLERRQKARLADDPAYLEYASKTPIIIPLIPLYTLDFPKKNK
jgi:steroid 5-alpha reductase family enzyme